MSYTHTNTLVQIFTCFTKDTMVTVPFEKLLCTIFKNSSRDMYEVILKDYVHSLKCIPPSLSNLRVD